jgi:transposase
MRIPKKKPFSSSRKYSKFKVNNWSSYNKYLRNRGRIDFMIAEDLVNGWYDERPMYRKRGRQKKYSDLAILQCLQIRCLFGLKLRQTEGFINYIFEVSGLSIACPDYTSLSKRGKKLGLDLLLTGADKEFSHVAMDSTGIATYTGNEWLENKHGKRYSRRVWKKLHVVVDEEGNIIANSTTSHIEDDRPQVEVLLKCIKSKEFLGDTGYDGEEIYQQLRQKAIKPTIRPPNSSVAIKLEHLKTERDRAVEYRQNRGYQAWRVKNKYGRRERVENTFFRFKTSFGNKFLSRDETNMSNEMIIKCQLLNKMLEIGKPISVRVC